ncbi:hypothetical protein [Planococcus sp. CP5-4_UN]|uniref:hypothetical protein n=1 Tax=Planococcus sp. CP5-4_UN TaxID=2850852 RepID=UPI001C2B9413|nr:hypothetical protein [Planococcus sp. CP5-4_UN]
MKKGELLSNSHFAGYCQLHIIILTLELYSTRDQLNSNMDNNKGKFFLREPKQKELREFLLSLPKEGKN